MIKMKTKIIILFFLISFLDFSFLVSAQSTLFWPFNLPAWDINYIATILHIPQSTFQSPGNLIFQLIVPFIAIWAICLGFLKQIRIFPSSPSLEIIIAFTMSFATLPSGILTSIVNVLLALSGTWAVGAFFAMFIVGVGLYSWNWPGFTFRISGLEKRIKAIDREIEKIDHQIDAAGNNEYEVDRLKEKRDALEVEKRRAEAAVQRYSAHERERYEKRYD